LLYAVDFLVSAGYLLSEVRHYTYRQVAALLSVVKERKRQEQVLLLSLMRASQADKEGFGKILGLLTEENDGS